MKLTILSILLLLGLTSCATYKDFTNGYRVAAKKQASFDFNCPEEKIKVKQLGASGFGVKGCGKRASYVGVNCEAFLGTIKNCTVVQSSKFQKK